MFVVLKSLNVPDRGDVDEFVTELGHAASTLPGMLSHFVAPTLPNGINDGQVIWRLGFKTESDYRECLRDARWRAKIEPLVPGRGDTCLDRVSYEMGRWSSPFPNIQNGIWRALIFSLAEGTEASVRQQFEAEMLAMPRHVTTIRNWCLSRVAASSGARRWSYVWEQDFDDLQGLQGEYMMHPIHWGSIDRWYDVEHPDHIVDGYLIHTACSSATGLISPRHMA